MLIQFSVGNYRSIKDPQTLSMVASSGLKRLRETNTFSPSVEGHKVPNLLRCAAIFGPNAAGKTNLVKALRLVEKTVLRSATASPDKPIDVQPFRLDPQSANGDSTFEVDFIEDGIRFQFGFSANKDQITKEWLISYTSARPKELYRREFDSETGLHSYTFGRALEGGRLRHDWAAQTGPKTLYLSRVVQASSAEFKQLRVPYKWFSRRLRIDNPELPPMFRASTYTSEICEKPEGKAKVLAFLNALDIPIADIHIKKSTLDLKTVPFNEDFMQKLKLDDEDLIVREPTFMHKSSNGDMVSFASADESDGTLNLYNFAAKWIDTLENNFVLLVDELDSSLHPLAVWELIRRLCESQSHAQLIFTTHDVTVLRSKLLRRDQTFFVSPNKERESQLYSLVDFKGREEDAFEDRYLQGRYGATPIISR